jgi:hypothetical protein
VIPHAVALCNEWLLDRFDRPRPPAVQPGSVAALSEELERLEDTLRVQWVPNPFFYPTEQALCTRALAEQGIVTVRERAEAQVLKQRTQVELARETQRERFEANVAGLLGFLSVLAFDPLLVDSMPWLQRLAPWLAVFEAKPLGHAFTLVLACVIGFVIFAWKRPSPDGRGLDAARRPGLGSGGGRSVINLVPPSCQPVG